LKKERKKNKIKEFFSFSFLGAPHNHSKLCASPPPPSSPRSSQQNCNASIAAVLRRKQLHACVDGESAQLGPDGEEERASVFDEFFDQIDELFDQIDELIDLGAASSTLSFSSSSSDREENLFLRRRIRIRLSRQRSLRSSYQTQGHYPSGSGKLRRRLRQARVSLALQGRRSQGRSRRQNRLGPQRRRPAASRILEGHAGAQADGGLVPREDRRGPRGAEQ
jgi:hypothetical protein